MWCKLAEHRSKLFLSFLLLQLLILFFLIFSNYLPLLLGSKITVEVLPVDPRSLFQGDYVILSYPFNTLYLNEIEHDLTHENLDKGETLYLTFASRGKIHEPDFITADKQKTKGRVYLKISAQNYSYFYSPVQPRLSAHWGIEQFYVPEGTGKEIEKQINQGKVYANLSIYRGKGRVSGLKMK